MDVGISSLGSPVDSDNISLYSGEGIIVMEVLPLSLVLMFKGGYNLSVHGNLSVSGLVSVGMRLSYGVDSNPGVLLHVNVSVGGVRESSRRHSVYVHSLELILEPRGRSVVRRRASLEHLHALVSGEIGYTMDLHARGVSRARVRVPSVRVASRRVTVHLDGIVGLQRIGEIHVNLLPSVVVSVSVLSVLSVNDHSQVVVSSARMRHYRRRNSVVSRFLNDNSAILVMVQMLLS